MSLSVSIPDVDILRQIAERSLSVFFVYNLHTHRFEYVSPAFEEVWGREEQDINEQLPWLAASVCSEDLPLLEKCYQQLLHNAYRQFQEFRIRLAEDREKWIHLTAFAIMRDGQRHAIAGFAEDITHHKQHEIVANNYSLQKNGILEMLAHDLNGPLGVMQKLAGQLEQKARQIGSPDLERDAGLIEKTATHSILLIHDLLEKEFLESSQSAPKIQRTELIGQIESMLKGFERMDQDDHKHFELQSSSPQVFAVIDQVKFMQALANLVANANKFTRPGGHIRVRVQEQPGSLLISVSDDGIGIPKDLQPILFDRFTKARRPGLRGEVTTGLGLSIVKRIVELHRGKVWVDSEENQGSTFYIRIPRQG